ncbi:MAG: tail fiber domain-containing protein [Bdellovibrio sp.]
MAERLRVDNNGNVGIGTTAPGRGIVAAPVVDVQIPYAKTDTSIRYGMFIGGNDTYPLGAAFYTVGAASSSGRSFNIQATELGSSINSLNLNPQGANVGIGTTVPGTTLDIRNPSAANGVNSSIFHAGVGTDATLGPLFFEVWGNPSATAASRYMGIVAADWSTVRPLILNTATNGVKGNVGIGTTSPSTTLQVSGTTTLAGGDFQFLDAGVADSTAVRLFSNGGNLYLQNGSGGATYIRSKTAAPIVTVLDGGTVGIGTTTPAHKLEVNGQIAVQSIAGRQGVNGSSNGSAFNFWWDGSCVHIWVDYTDFSISCPSDERVKTSIQSVLNTEGIDLVEKLKPVSYKWKKSDADKGIHYGFLAQEVQKILPAVVKNTGLISNDTPDGMLRIDYEQFIPILTKAIQDLKKESNELHGTCKASEDQMNAISRELASINDKTSKLEAENAKLKANDSAKDQKIHKLEQENAAIKAYLCGKDPGAGFCH